MIPFIKLRWVWYLFSGTLIVLSIGGWLLRGLPYGIDFTGGSLLELRYSKEVPAPEDIRQSASKANISSVNLQRTDEGYLIRMPEITDEQHKRFLLELKGSIGQLVDSTNQPDVKVDSTGAIKNVGVGVSTTPSSDAGKNTLTELRFDAVGPVIGKELKSRSVEALILVLLAIMAYVAWAFRKVSWPVKSWKYGAVAVIALFHDVIITIGAYLLASSFFGWEVDTVFVAALLTILGYSVNDTIVVFDRIRENLPKMSESFEDIINASVNQTLGRSINTSLTTVLVLIAILIFGGATLRPFMFALIIGIASGTYSSIFVASPLLVTWQKWSEKRS